jgi:exodeoxyribonuclease VII large subunit
MDTYSLFELNEYIKRVIALNFNEPIWIKAEISQVKNSRGQIYMDLIQKDEESNSVLAQSSAIVWYKNYLFLKRKLGEILDDILIDGVEVRLKVLIEYHEKFGLKLNIQDIDPSFTLGKLEMQKKAIIERLQKENLIEKNAGLDLPTVVQRIAVISSATAAGLQDFEKQLLNNPYNFHFEMTLYNTAVQGSKVEREITGAIREINSQSGQYDCIAILRGGGSKLDLSGFDNYEIGKAIANANIPVITGIGHEIDMSIADLCAHTALKTPTAIANYLIDSLLHFESSLYEMMRSIAAQTQNRITKEKLKMINFSSQLQSIFSSKIEMTKQQLDHLQQKIQSLTHLKLDNSKNKLVQAEALLRIIEPANILKKGYSITRKQKEIISSVSLLQSGDEITTELKDGTFESKIK